MVISHGVVVLIQWWPDLRPLARRDSPVAAQIPDPDCCIPCDTPNTPCVIAGEHVVVERQIGVGMEVLHPDRFIVVRPRRVGTIALYIPFDKLLLGSAGRIDKAMRRGSCRRVRDEQVAPHRHIIDMAVGGQECPHVHSLVPVYCYADVRGLL